MEEWMQQYVVQAPESGKVIFLSPVQEAQFVAVGQELFYIAPDESRYYGELMVGQNGIGKIKNGQPVLLKVDGYPSAEFGTLKGVVEHISPMPVRQDSFRLRVGLPKGLHTNYGRALYFKNGLSASAEVLTDDRKLLERLVGEIRNVLKM
ncbi:HlyD family efflux transporter periplasmic adaptor subunit [Paracnuella aquatica]|uniref:HlyD family efflux transporter periplasmic adaptor subunit n=1 Tax=Paracnuella aquatica TaxID=2268757 RepID=UPI000F4DDE4D|nr:HlyD family efflux transporter periplasmic adaptor subunit [Paracnuella aquatica]RPD43497.1 HlyD family secretion protein [Paracnuella aquatica]